MAKNESRNLKRVHMLFKELKGRHPLIVIQDNPDPDAIAGAVALRRLLRGVASRPAQIAFDGIIGRAENHALIRYLRPPMTLISRVRWKSFDKIAMVDTQPSQGNNSLPRHMGVDVVIDHHPLRAASRRAAFVDVRPGIGSTSTMLTHYLREAGAAPDRRLATALLFGIMSDTQDLGREATTVDDDAHLYLLPLADQRALARIRHESVPREYFGLLNFALTEARVYDGVVLVYVGKLENPDMLGEVADLLLRLQGVRWSACYGVFRASLLISLRSSRRHGDAHHVMRRVVRGMGSGGGHRLYAGGKIPLDSADEQEISRVVAEVEQRFRSALRVSKICPERLLPAREISSRD